MKKVFFAFVATAIVVLTACNNKPAATETTPADTTAVKAAVTSTDTAAKPAATDTTAAMPASGSK